MIPDTLTTARPDFLLTDGRTMLLHALEKVEAVLTAFEKELGEPSSGSRVVEIPLLDLANDPRDPTLLRALVVLVEVEHLASLHHDSGDVIFLPWAREDLRLRLTARGRDAVAERVALRRDRGPT